MTALSVRVDAVSFVVPSGALVGITGPSGSGKSTLLSLLAGLDRPTAGSIHLGDVRTDTLTERELLALRAKTLAVVMQQPQQNLLPYATATDNIRFARRARPRAERGRRRRPEQLLSDLGISASARTRADRLSGGERQRLALAVGLANEPDLLLLDEPTSQLDARNRDAVVRLLRSIASTGVTIIAITHDETVAAGMDDCLRLADGRLVREVP